MKIFGVPSGMQQQSNQSDDDSDENFQVVRVSFNNRTAEPALIPLTLSLPNAVAVEKVAMGLSDVLLRCSGNRIFFFFFFFF